jgi:hypothetical protein
MQHSIMGHRKFYIREQQAQEMPLLAASTHGHYPGQAHKVQHDQSVEQHEGMSAALLSMAIYTIQPCCC